MKNTTKAYLSASLYSIFAGCSFLFVKIALGYTNPIDLLFYRYLVSFIFVIILSIKYKDKLSLSKDRVLKLLPLSIFYPTLFFLFQTFGLQYTTSSEAGIFSALTPIFTLILASILIDEKTNTYQKISVLISVLGVIYITIKKSNGLEISNMKGIIFLILSTLSFSIYSIMLKSYTKEYNSMELSFTISTFGFIFFSILSLINRLKLGTISKIFLPLGNINFLMAIIYLGFLASLCTSLLTSYSLKTIKASQMSVFSNLATVISIIAGVIVLNEEVYYYHIIGSLMIIIGVVGVNFLKEK